MKHECNFYCCGGPASRVPGWSRGVRVVRSFGDLRIHFERENMSKFNPLLVLPVFLAAVAANATQYADSATKHFNDTITDAGIVGGSLIAIGGIAVGIVFLVRLLRRGQP